MFSFAYTYILYFLLLIPLFILLYLWARYARIRKLRRFGKKNIIADLMPDVSSYKPPVKFTIELIVLLAIILAAARPWGGVKDQKTTKEGIEVILAVDASNSMYASATDNPDGPDRMRLAKSILEKLINRLDNDRVGLIVYAGSSYTLIPVTNDYVSAKMFLNSIDPSQISDQGTNISAALEMASASFSENKNIGKAIIMITDAEELDNKEGVMNAAKNAAKNNIQLDVVGVGTSTPVSLTVNGSPMIDDQTGEPVKTALNEDLAADIAKAGKGIYVNASNEGALNELEKQLDMVKKSALETNLYAQHDELFTIFAWIALVGILLNILLLDRKNAWLDKFTFFKKEVKK